MSILRTLAILLILSLFCAPGHAEMAPMVQCRIGSAYVHITPDFVCAALQKGASKLKLGSVPIEVRNQSVLDCEAEVARHIQGDRSQISTECWAMYLSLNSNVAMPSWERPGGGLPPGFDHW
jgi:hypothetical protein